MKVIKLTVKNILLSKLRKFGFVIKKKNTDLVNNHLNNNLKFKSKCIFNLS